MHRKTLLPILMSAAALAVATPRAAQAMEESPWFRYLEAEVDYADWGRNKRQMTWDAEGWIGGDTEKMWVKSEGEWSDGDLEEAEIQALYSRMIAPFWDVQAGLRHDFRPDPTNYLVVALKGLAPYDFETDLSLFLSDEGDVSFRPKVSADLLITQRLIAEPYVEAEFFASDVPEQHVGAGLASIDTGLQIRYEVVRELAPYIDLNYTDKFGETGRLAEAEGESPDDFTVRIGLRFWIN